MDNQLLAKLWSDLWERGLWAGPWQKALADLSPAQATWRPAPGRKCIWEFVTHVTFWRNFMLDREAGKPRPTQEQIDVQHFAIPADPTPADWLAAQETLRQGIDRMIAVAREGTVPTDKLAPALAHDAYHLGQVMYLRALQGLPPVD